MGRGRPRELVDSLVVIVYMDKALLSELDAASRMLNISRAELIRRAVHMYIRGRGLGSPEPLQHLQSGGNSREESVKNEARALAFKETVMSLFNDMKRYGAQKHIEEDLRVKNLKEYKKMILEILSKAPPGAIDDELLNIYRTLKEWKLD